MLKFEDIMLKAERPQEFISEVESGYHDMLKDFTEKILGHGGRKIIALSGPSGSGKTTTAKLLEGYFEQRGVMATQISLDDFYLGRDMLPLMPNGKLDYETVNALNLPVLRDCMNELIQSGTTHIPQFDFMKGKPGEHTREVHIGGDDIAIVEGIHAMNPLFVDFLPHDQVTRLYVSVEDDILTPKGVITRRDVRLVRRLTRDFLYRNSTPQNTFSLWGGVEHGERNYLFPHKSTADYTINSIHAYEPCLFRNVFVGHMEQVLPHEEWYSQARRMHDIMEQFCSIPVDMIPKSSILQEFIGV